MGNVETPRSNPSRGMVPIAASRQGATSFEASLVHPISRLATDFMHTSRSVFAAAVVTLFALGCKEPTGTPESRALDAAEKLWQAKGISSYTVEARVSCFCHPSLGIWSKLTVAQGQITKVEQVEASIDYPPTLAGWLTVAGIFERVRAVTSAGGSAVSGVAGVEIREIKATYDPTLGYPREVALTCAQTVADCGVTYQMRNLIVTSIR